MKIQEVAMEFWKSTKSPRGSRNPVPQTNSTLNFSRDPYFEDNEKEIQTVEQIRTRETTAQGSLQMKVVRPKKLSDKDAHDIADSLKLGQTIVLNLDEMNDSDGRRMIDFIAGFIYAIQGKIERPADRTFLLTQYGEQVATDDQDPS